MRFSSPTSKSSMGRTGLRPSGPSPPPNRIAVRLDNDRCERTSVSLYRFSALLVIGRCPPPTNTKRGYNAQPRLLCALHDIKDNADGPRAQRKERVFTIIHTTCTQRSKTRIVIVIIIIHIIVVCIVRENGLRRSYYTEIGPSDKSPSPIYSNPVPKTCVRSNGCIIVNTHTHVCVQGVRETSKPNGQPTKTFVTIDVVGVLGER